MGLIVIINYNTGTSGTTTFIVCISGLHVSTYTQVIFRPTCTRESIKSYALWDPTVHSFLWTQVYRRAWRWPV